MSDARGTILVTGAAGFIGMHVTQRLLADGRAVVGIDNLNAYYDPRLKQARLDALATHPNFRFQKTDIADRSAIAELFAAHQFPYVVHLAAQPGVRGVEAQAYVEANLVGFANVIEASRQQGCDHFLYASSSSVYGANPEMPFRTSDRVDHPFSIYGASKKANELMAHAYAHLYGMPTTGLRFFTVYGPWGRPDMAMWLFAQAIMEGRPVRLFNDGKMRRDFTYVDDVIEAVVRLVPRPPAPGVVQSNAASRAPWRVYNVGNHRPVEITELVRLMERELGRPATLEFLPMQPGDVPETYADVADLQRDVGFSPKTPIDEGVRRFVAWFRGYHGR